MNKVIDHRNVKYLYASSLPGNCHSCGAELSSGGFFIIEESGTVIQQLCPECKEVLELTATTKKSKLTVKKLYGFFSQGYYQLLSTQNLAIFSRIITDEQLKKYIENPNVDVIVKYE